MAHVLGKLDIDKNQIYRFDSVLQFTQLAQGNEGSEPWSGFPKLMSCPASYCLPGRANGHLPCKAAPPLRFLGATILIVWGKEEARPIIGFP